ncbi:hypothetical protein C8J57DRAFT_1235887 [Mycena rebaudengoi]|nr:hypothetical protein C8J57DRAFT_1235887 [Mycena rebaudengoi]
MGLNERGEIENQMKKKAWYRTDPPAEVRDWEMRRGILKFEECQTWGVSESIFSSVVYVAHLQVTSRRAGGADGGARSVSRRCQPPIGGGDWSWISSGIAAGVGESRPVPSRAGVQYRRAPVASVLGVGGECQSHVSWVGSALRRKGRYREHVLGRRVLVVGVGSVGAWQRRARCVVGGANTGAPIRGGRRCVRGVLLEALIPSGAVSGCLARGGVGKSRYVPSRVGADRRDANDGVGGDAHEWISNNNRYL